ncbi:MAG: Adenylate cyclase [Myxococcaceae bacterium]|nr:Adenylate cyclase [Myxococcaceae bacterium]
MCVARFRLRFLLQELDLIGPLITVGRSSECQITLEDPLVSRVHAELVVGEGCVAVRDLGSRNGVRVNGVLIHGQASLKHNDRLRLGTQDLVFLAVGSSNESVRIPRATGAMAHCRQCSRPFPGESSACPHCGTVPPFGPGNGPETITGVELADAPSWTFRLIAEVIERALTAGRVPEAERMLERAARDIDARVVAHRKVGLEQVTEAAHFAVRLAKLKMRPEWAGWAIRLYRAEHMTLGAATLELLESLDPATLLALGPELEALLSASSSDSGISSVEARLAHQRVAALLSRAAG